MAEIKKKPFATLCGRIFRDTDSQYFPSTEYRGKKIILCTESCLGRFLADPDIFCKVHRNSEKVTSKIKTEITSLVELWKKQATPSKKSE